MENIKEGNMKAIVQDFLEQRISRREFTRALAAVGVAASSVESVVRTVGEGAGSTWHGSFRLA